jgi:drug/metabolite transporter (DMT)-like permease
MSIRDGGRRPTPQPDPQPDPFAGPRPLDKPESAAAPAPLPPLAGVLLLLLVATVFASNHVAARLAFDHGTSVATAVAVRSVTTVVVVLGLLRSTGTSLRLPAPTLRRAILIGLLLSVQSYCLYAAVARLPVALALLTFNTFPLLLAAISWLIGGQRPGRRTLIAMPVILLGLTLALNVTGVGADPAGNARGAAGTHWSPTMSAGVAFALTASSTFALALFLTTRWLGGVDGRLRALLTMATVGTVVLVVGWLAGRLGLADGAAGGIGSAFALPDAPAGWLGLALLSLLYTAAFTTLFALLPRLGAVNNAPVLNFEPIAALVLASQILGQKVLPIQIAGAFLVIGAIVFLTTGPRR